MGEAAVCHTQRDHWGHAGPTPATTGSLQGGEDAHRPTPSLTATPLSSTEEHQGLKSRHAP